MLGRVVVLRWVGLGYNGTCVSWLRLEYVGCFLVERVRWLILGGFMGFGLCVLGLM